MCVRDPGLDVDIDVEAADLATLIGVWLGEVAFHAALRSGVRLRGPPCLTAASRGG